MPTNVLGNEKMEKKIIEHISDHPTGTWVEEVARDLKINRATASKYIIRLEALGKVRLEKRGQMKVIFPVAK